jgi:exopolysaccharide production protein ExoZ
MTRNSSSKLESVQALRAAAVMLVLVFHIAEAARMLSSAPALNWTGSASHFGFGGVNLFFVISGFIMVHISRRHWGDPSHWAGFLWRRWARIFPSYWAAFALTFAVFVLFTRHPWCFAGSGFTMAVSSLFLLPIGSPNCYVPQVWTLHWEIYFYLIFSLVFLIPRRLILALGFGWAALSTLIAFGGRDWVSTWGYEFNVYNLQFLLGVGVALTISQVERRWALPALSLGWLWFLGSGVVNALGCMDRLDPFHRLLQFGFSSALIVYGAASLESRRDLTLPSWVRLLGDASYSIYLTHLTVFLILRKLMENMDQGLLGHTVWVVALALGGTIAGIAFHLIVERPFVRLVSLTPSRMPSRISASGSFSA